MDNLRTSIAEDLRTLVLDLDVPFPESASANGWNIETWTKWAQQFRHLSQSFEQGKAIPEASISRAMDADGITGGSVLDLAARVSNMLREYRNGN